MTHRLYGECLGCEKPSCFSCEHHTKDISRIDMIGLNGDGEEGAGHYGPISPPTPLLPPMGGDVPIESEGGSSSYYTFYRDDGSPMETEEVIRCLVGNDFDLGNIIKACRRIHEAEQGRGKAGTSVLYDWNKISYSAEKRKNLIIDNDSERNK